MSCVHLDSWKIGYFFGSFGFMENVHPRKGKKKYMHSKLKLKLENHTVYGDKYSNPRLENTMHG